MELYVTGLRHRVTALKLNGQRIPMADLARTRPVVEKDGRPVVDRREYYSNGNVNGKVQLYRVVCPHCGAVLWDRIAIPPHGTDAQRSGENKAWALWWGHLASTPACLAKAPASAEAEGGRK